MRRRFTFIEVMTAVAVLGIALIMLLSLIGAARARLIRAEERWARQHLLDTATEFFLLAGPEEDLPSHLLPDGFAAECTVSVAGDLPDHAVDPYGGWALATYHIVLYRDGAVAVEQRVDKVVREEDL